MALWFPVGSRTYTTEMKLQKRQVWDQDLSAFGKLGDTGTAVMVDSNLQHVSIAIKHANGLPAGVFKVQPLMRQTELSFQTVNHLCGMTAPLLQQSINDLANLHIGDVPPPSRLGVGRSVEARMMLASP